MSDGRILYVDFSGGMNTRDLSTSLSPNELILGKNARPMLRGGVEKRKGVLWGSTATLASYNTGTVNVVNGSNKVTGTGFNINVDVGDLFNVPSATAYYTVASVDSNTQVTLTENYAGTTAAGTAYLFTKGVNGFYWASKMGLADTDSYRMFACVGNRIYRQSGAENTWVYVRSIGTTKHHTRMETFFTELNGILFISKGAYEIGGAISATTACQIDLATMADSDMVEPAGFNARMYVRHGEYLFAIGSPNYPDRIMRSYSGNGNDWTTVPGVGTFAMETQANWADGVVGAFSTQYSLIILSRYTSWILGGRGDTPSMNFAKLHDSIGCVAPKSIATDGLGQWFWLSDKGVARLRGSGDIDIVSGQIEPEVRKFMLNETPYGRLSLSRAVGMFDGRYYRLSVPYAETFGGTVKRDRTWVYDTWGKRGGWWRDDGYFMAGGCVYRPATYSYPSGASIHADGFYAGYANIGRIMRIGYDNDMYSGYVDQTGTSQTGVVYPLDIQTSHQDDGLPFDRKTVINIKAIAETITFQGLATTGTLSIEGGADGKAFAGLTPGTMDLKRTGSAYFVGDTIQKDRQMITQVGNRQYADGTGPIEGQALGVRIVENLGDLGKNVKVRMIELCYNNKDKPA